MLAPDTEQRPEPRERRWRDSSEVACRRHEIRRHEISDEYHRGSRILARTERSAGLACGSGVRFTSTPDQTESLMSAGYIDDASPVRPFSAIDSPSTPSSKAFHHAPITVPPLQLKPPIEPYQHVWQRMGNYFSRYERPRYASRPSVRWLPIDLDTD
jgi:hypothetical protein